MVKNHAKRIIGRKNKIVFIKQRLSTLIMMTMIYLFLRQFKPIVFREGNTFCVILGPDPQVGVFGCGDTLEAVIKDWDNHLADEIGNPTEGNETTRYILDNLNTF